MSRQKRKMIILENFKFKVIVSSNHGSIVNVVDKKGNCWLWGPKSSLNYSPQKGGCFPLTPYANRIKNGEFFWEGKLTNIDDNGSESPHALHGDGWMRSWKIQEFTNERVVKMYHRSRYAPFNYEANQVVKLIDNELHITMSITHLGRSPLPYGLGFHPWFPKDPDTCLYAPAERVWTEGIDHLPKKLIPIPNLLRFNSERSPVPMGYVNNLFVGWKCDDFGFHNAAILYPSRGTSIDIKTSFALNRYMLYTDSEEFLCFEPVSHNVDAHNTKNLGGLKILREGETLSVKMKLTFKDLLE